MKEKLIAGLLAALTTLTTVYPVLAATVADIPGFLGQPSNDFLVVVGAAANTADVVGAADVAMALAVQSTTQKTVPGSAAAANGLEYNTIDPSYGKISTSDGGPFPDLVKTFHFSGLKQGTITWKSNTYDYHEQIKLNAGSNPVLFSHDFGTTGINGTEKMVLYSGQIAYEYVFDKALNISSASGKGTLSNPEYSYPVNINLLGTTFQIVATDVGQVKMLVGSVGTADATTPVVYGQYSVYATLGSNTYWTKVVIKDSAGNTVDSAVINDGDSKDSTAAGLTIKVTAVRALQDGTVVGADLVVGPVGAVEKTFMTSCDVTATGLNDVKFPGQSDWCIQVSGFSNGAISSGDKIQVIWKPTTSPQYFGVGTSLALPGDYAEIGFEGWNYNTFATLTFGLTPYHSAYYLSAIGGTTNSTPISTNLNGVEIASDVGGTLLVGGTGYKQVYILFGPTSGSGSGTQYPVYLGVWDSVNNRVGVVSNATGTGDYMYFLNGTAGAPAAAASKLFNITVSYGGGAAAADQQFLLMNVSILGAGTPTQGTSPTSLFNTFQLGTSSNANAVRIGFYNKSATWSSTSAPDFRLYASDSAEAKDVSVDSTDTSGNVQLADVGGTSQSVVSDSGAIVVAPNSNAASNKVVVQVPAQALKVKAYVGNLGATAGSQTYLAFNPVTVPVAKLDTEVDALAKTKNLVIVGGPCVNRIAAEALSLTFPACGAASTIPANAALIKVVADYPATGKNSVVIAGWEAVNTRTACAVVQQYSTLLAGQTVSAVKVTAATAAGITPL